MWREYLKDWWLSQHWACCIGLWLGFCIAHMKDTWWAALGMFLYAMLVAAWFTHNEKKIAAAPHVRDRMWVDSLLATCTVDEMAKILSKFQEIREKRWTS